MPNNQYIEYECLKCGFKSRYKAVMTKHIAEYHFYDIVVQNTKEMNLKRLK